MGDVDIEKIPISSMSDKEISDFIKKNYLALKVDEVKKIVDLIGRDPTLTEIHMFNIQWSEHCSYKSSKPTLKLLPTSGPTVIQGPKEDAGIIHLKDIGDDRYGIVIAHESHNHPSQVVPYEGAATGIGGIVRDVLCMGARVIATADPLRFGDPNGKKKDYTKYVANSVIDGIAGYSNPLGVPNLAGDIYFDESFDDNCLVNVACLGLIKEKDIIHSEAPENAEGYDIIVVGKATDNSGFGGAAFASLTLDEDEEEYNKGAVQVPDPFLKNILFRATEAVFKEAREKGIKLGFKDMGAGGIMCASSELCQSGGFGADMDVNKIHISMKDLPPYVIACGETQERFTWVSPKEFTPRILEIYNKEFELPNIAEGARASVVGKVTKNKYYILKHDNKIVCNVPIDALTSGIFYDREYKESKRVIAEPKISAPEDYNKTALKVLNDPDVASKAVCYKHYDTEVQGLAVIRPGEADAGIQAPIPGDKVGIALSTDCNPRISKISPYWGAANAVAEAIRNVAAVGAVARGMTDCLNYGNPEKPEAFNDFLSGVKGLSDAANKIKIKDMNCATPFVSGNVSFYNESISGKSVAPSAIIACLGVIDDYKKALTMKLKKEGSTLYLLGERKDELGGSVYYKIHNELGSNVPKVEFEKESKMNYAVIDAINNGLLLSCHDISDGGLVTTISEMILGGEADGKLGVDINLDFSELRPDKTLFAENGGFVFEADENNIEKINEIIKKYDLELITLGKVIGDSLIANSTHKEIINLPIPKLKEAWTTGFVNALK